MHPHLRRYCTTCNIFRPPRSKHCSFCTSALLELRFLAHALYIFLRFWSTCCCRIFEQVTTAYYALITTALGLGTAPEAQFASAGSIGRNACSKTDPNLLRLPMPFLECMWVCSCLQVALYNYRYFVVLIYSSTIFLMLRAASDGLCRNVKLPSS